MRLRLLVLLLFGLKACNAMAAVGDRVPYQFAGSQICPAGDLCLVTLAKVPFGRRFELTNIACAMDSDAAIFMVALYIHIEPKKLNYYLNLPTANNSKFFTTVQPIFFLVGPGQSIQVGAQHVGGDMNHIECVLSGALVDLK
jgi:hypothetical protein